ncbi:protein OBERON 4 [Mercurialis annua]|uniref:protein OBERON 4 n=1 Tax=Mercurialis annua TaxID=3986 RepID=UPI00215FED01|nr:protein OBERON 4 [Mercurialis annua]
MKRLKSSDDLESYNNEKSSNKDSNPNRSSRSFYYKSDNVRKGLMSTSSSSGRYDRDRSVDDDSRESSRMVRKRSDHDFDGFDRRKGAGLGFDRYGSREGHSSGGSREGHSGGGSDRVVHRSESFCGSRRDFPKGFRSERDRSRREGSVSSWRRFGGVIGKEFDESSRGVRSGNEERLNVNAATRSSPNGRGGNEERLNVNAAARSSPNGRGGIEERLNVNAAARSSPNGRGGIEERLNANAAARSSPNGRGGNEERLNVNAAARSSPKGLRDVKSPSWSRDSGSEQTRVVRGSVRDEGKGKSSNSKSRSSPTWSKDSGSEQSKSVEVAKKSEVEAKSAASEIEVKSVVASGSSSEMEEGELEPEPESVPQAVEEVKEDATDTEKGRQENFMSNADNREVENDTEVKDQVNKVEKESDKASSHKVNFFVKEVNKMSSSEESLNDGNSTNEDEIGNMKSDERGEKSQSLNEKSVCKEEHQDMVVDKPVYVQVETRTEKVIDLVDKVDDVEASRLNKVIKEENGVLEMNIGPVTEALGQNLKDKGKSVAVSQTHAADASENGAWIERESRNIAACRDEEDDMEGPSTRAFELFTSSPVRRFEKTDHGLSKPKDEKLMLEPLDLSLSLPNVLLPIGASKDAAQAPGSPSHGRSVQSFSSFRTNSDGFTASMSFSGSQSFFHNPSCSLTQNSIDMDNYEQSVHSRPLFQGIDQGIWPGLAQNDSKHKDVPLYQKVLLNGNGSVHQSQSLQGLSNGQALQGSSKIPNGLERQLSFHKQLSGQGRNPDETRSPSQSIGSHDIGSTYSLEKKRPMRENHEGRLYRSNSQKEQEQFLIGGADFVETIVSRIVSDPIHVMARKFHEMTGQSTSLVKESIREMMLNADKQGQLYAFQSALQNRSDLSLDILLKSHRCQLQILVALKTGLREYLQVDNNISSPDLAEVFLNLRCRNLTCRSPVPVDECDCKVCSKKSGFCSSCMCLVCSKFDMAYQTCSWVGCDVCLHWCHTDCALRESYIRNGKSANGAQGSAEMQFHCVACDHPSEMFGFVKEVYINFAKTWGAETFCKELQYVKRIFSGSKGVRGRRLYEISARMLEKLTNKSKLPEVYSCIMGFLNESDSSKFSNTSSFLGKEQGNGSNVGTAGPSQDASWLKSVYKEKAPQLERSNSLLPTFHTDLHDKRRVDPELERSAQKEPVFDELESIVRIKHAEAKMFQSRADDARRESEGLKRIALAKNEKIEEEYTSRITKLRLLESEEMRKQKFEEFQSLERAHQEYFSLKMRMESDIKDLLLKMEATKRNLAR